MVLVPCGGVRIEQGSDHGTIWNRAPIALLNHSVHRLLEAPEILDLATDFLDMSQADVSDFRAGVVPAIDELEQHPDFLERESELAGSADEAKPPHVLLRVEAMAAFAADRIGHQADALVVADRLDIASGALR